MWLCNFYFLVFFCFCRPGWIQGSRTAPLMKSMWPRLGFERVLVRHLWSRLVAACVASWDGFKGRVAHP